jgi:hypothetical protein
MSISRLGTRTVSKKNERRAATRSTATEGFLGYFITVPVFQMVIPSSLTIDASILIGGTISGMIGGWLTAFVWNRHLFPRPADGPIEAERKTVAATANHQ